MNPTSRKANGGIEVGEPTAFDAQSAPSLNASWIGLPPSRPWISPR